MARPRRERESVSALLEEWGLANAPAPELLRVAARIENWPQGLSPEQASKLVNEIRRRLHGARRLGKDITLLQDPEGGEDITPLAAAEHIAAKARVVYAKGHVLHGLILRATPARSRARAAELNELRRSQRRVNRFLSNELKKAAGRDYKPVISDLSEAAARLYRASEVRMRRRQTRSTHGPSAAPRALLISLGWWWIDQGWEPSTSGTGCFYRTARLLERFRSGTHTTFNTKLLSESLKEARHFAEDGIDAAGRWSKGLPWNPDETT